MTTLLETPDMMFPILTVAHKLWVGNQAAYEALPKHQDWAVVHACKEPFHRKALGYTGRGAPKDDPEYLFAYRPIQDIAGFPEPNRLILNLVDGDDPAYVRQEIIDEALSFIRRNLESRNVLVHCNMGGSRSPTIGMLYLRQNGAFDSMTFEEGEKMFRRIYAPYTPGRGMREFARENWNRYRTDPKPIAREGESKQ